MRRVGIEKINIYSPTLFLDQRKLAIARDKDPDKVLKDFLIENRSLNPPWEDTVTMGANASFPLFNTDTAIDKKDIGFLVVGTEGSVDFGKPISTNIHGALGLESDVRNYETKHACYSGVAALDAAINWVASGLNKGKKALVISTDFSRMHLNAKEEFVLGGLAAALIVSDNPRIIEYETEKRGTWTTNIYDTFRPSARHEVGNNEVSLFTYMDALEGSYNEYKKQTGDDIDFDNYFTNNIYHTPFPGMSFQAHRTLCNINKPRKKPEIVESFNQKVLPSLRIVRKLGSSYGASNFAGICSLLLDENPPREGDRIGFFSYGSGAIGEYYSGLICKNAVQQVKNMRIEEKISKRREVSVEEYETIEKMRESAIEVDNFLPDFSILDNWFDKHYRGKGLLYLKEVNNFYRNYERS